MASEETLLKLLDIASQRAKDHHDSLWEEEKHYMWWAYIIFAGLFFLRFGGQLFIRPTEILILTIIGSVFGIFMSLTAYSVVRREGEYFHEALQISARISSALNLNESKLPHPFVGESLLPPEEVTVETWYLVTSDANKPLLKLFLGGVKALRHASLKKRPSKEERDFRVRDGFQLTFIVLAVLFAAFGITWGILSFFSPDH